MVVTMRFNLLGNIFNKKRSAVKAGSMLAGEDVITEFSKTKNGFQDHAKIGYVEQTILPLRCIHTYSILGASRDLSLLVYILQELTGVFSKSKTGSAYGYYRQFVREDILKEKKSALIASVGMAKRVDVLSKTTDNFILCHAVPNEFTSGADVEVWTISKKKVTSIHSYKRLPIQKDVFVNELHDAIDNHKLKNGLRSHRVYIYGDIILGFDDNNSWPLELVDGFYQLPETELYKSAVELPLLNKKGSSEGGALTTVFISLFILLCGPAFVFGADHLYKSRFDDEKQEYIKLTKQINGLDEKGRNSSEVAIWEARDTHLRQQFAKKLDTDNLELLVRAVSGAASDYQSKVLVKTIDYSRELKSRNNLPDYHFRLELLILKSPLLSEGEAIDAIYRSLGGALADVTDEFVTPGTPREHVSLGRHYYRVEFVGRFTDKQIKEGGEYAKS